MTCLCALWLGDIGPEWKYCMYKTVSVVSGLLNKFRSSHRPVVTGTPHRPVYFYLESKQSRQTTWDRHYLKPAYSKHTPQTFGSSADTMQLTLLDDVSMQWCSKHRGAKFFTPKAEAFRKISFGRVTGRAAGPLPRTQTEQKRKRSRLWRTSSENGVKSKVTPPPASVQNESQRESQTWHEEQRHFLRTAVDKTRELTANRVMTAAKISLSIQRAAERQSETGCKQSMNLACVRC